MTEEGKRARERERWRQNNCQGLASGLFTVCVSQAIPSNTRRHTRVRRSSLYFSRQNLIRNSETVPFFFRFFFLVGYSYFSPSQSRPRHSEVKTVRLFPWQQLLPVCLSRRSIGPEKHGYKVTTTTTQSDKSQR